MTDVEGVESLTDAHRTMYSIPGDPVKTKFSHDTDSSAVRSGQTI